MKTLVFFGSPRPKGDTAALLSVFLESLGGNARIVSAYECGISPCVDCRCCHTGSDCAIHDGMDAVYGYIEESDAIVIASPVYFSELTGPLLSVMSRLQKLYTARMFRGEPRPPLTKSGAVLLAGGGSGGFERAGETAASLLRLMGAKCAGVAAARKTDSLPASQDEEALAEARRLGSIVKRDEI